MAGNTKPFSLLEPEVIITVNEEQEDEGMSVDIANKAGNNELIVDVKGAEKEGTNDVEMVGLRPFSLNRSVENVSADGVTWRFMVLFILAPDLSSAVNVVKLSRQSHTSISIESSTWVKCMSA
jgi:hypothetical protein